jgi:hypothetical protein
MSIKEATAADTAVLSNSRTQPDTAPVPVPVFWLAVCAVAQQRVGAARRWCVCPDCGNWRAELPRDGRCPYCREPIF